MYSVNNSGSQAQLWSKSGDQGNIWLRGLVPLTSDAEFRVKIKFFFFHYDDDGGGVCLSCCFDDEIIPLIGDDELIMTGKLQVVMI